MVRVICGVQGTFSEEIQQNLQSSYGVPSDLQHRPGSSRLGLPTLSALVIFVCEVFHNALRNQRNLTLGNCRFHNSLLSMDQSLETYWRYSSTSIENENDTSIKILP